jgi:hypothetical protein
MSSIQIPRERGEWEYSLKVGDLVDVNESIARAMPAGWYVARITEVTPNTEVTAAASVNLTLLYSGIGLNTIGQTSLAMQPLGSKTKGQYTGPPHRLTAFLQSLTLPSLTAVPLHPEHQLQKFSFDFDWTCSKCEKKKSAGQSQAYSCLSCKYDLCVDCFIDDGGIDRNPLTCVDPVAKRIKLETYSDVEFIDNGKEYHCAICQSTARKPINMPCGQYASRFQLNSFQVSSRI